MSYGTTKDVLKRQLVQTGAEPVEVYRKDGKIKVNQDFTDNDPALSLAVQSIGEAAVEDGLLVLCPGDAVKASAASLESIGLAGQALGEGSSALAELWIELGADTVLTLQETVADGQVRIHPASRGFDPAAGWNHILVQFANGTAIAYMIAGTEESN